MRLLRWIARTAGAALIGFHAWLLVSQWSAGRLSSDPALLLRWAAAFGLAAALIWLGREGTSLVSRRAVVIWLLAALLHGPAVASHADQGLQTLPETAASLLVQTTAIAGALLASIWIIAGLRSRDTSLARSWTLVRVQAIRDVLDDGFSVGITARPPPSLK